MDDHSVSKVEILQRSWLDFLALLLALGGALISFWGAAVTFLYVVQAQGGPLWPLPGMVLIEWMFLGLAGFATAALYFRSPASKLLNSAWVITGTLIPMIILGAFSIGTTVLIAFLLMAVSTIIYTARQQTRWLLSFGLLMLGSVCNLALLMAVITLTR